MNEYPRLSEIYKHLITNYSTVYNLSPESESETLDRLDQVEEEMTDLERMVTLLHWMGKKNIEISNTCSISTYTVSINKTSAINKIKDAING